MANTQHKRRVLELGTPTEQPPSTIRGGVPLDRFPYAKTQKQQDTLLYQSRRTVASQHMGGQIKAWLVPNGTDPDGQASQTHPDPDDDREVARYQFALAPGCMLEARSLFIPSGATQEFGGSTWDYTGGKGETRWSLTWDNDANNATSTAKVIQPPSPNQYNDEPNTFLGVWPSIKYGWQQLVVPSITWFSSAEAEKWSEWTTVTCTVNHRGAPRTIHADLTERPFVFVALNTDNAEQSAHAWDPENPKDHPDSVPKTKSADGATYEEHRFGSLKTLDVARRQADRMGPSLFAWSCYFEGDGSVAAGGNPGSVATADFPPTPFTTTSATIVCLWDSSTTAWSATAPGFAVPGAYAKRFAECDEQILTGAREATIPVRVSVYGSMDAGTGSIWLYTNDRSAIGWEITATVDGWQTFTGFVECQTRPDDVGTINGVLFGRSDGTNTLTIYYAQVEFGDFAQHV